MDTAKLRARFGAEVVRPWPFHPEHVPADDEWHNRREQPFAPGSIAGHLYGYGCPPPPTTPTA
jgi:hypothetical protein